MGISCAFFERAYSHLLYIQKNDRRFNMKVYNSKEIRNIALLGHGSCGKTILAEAMAYKTKLIDRMGKIEEKSTVSDYDAEEQARSFSISAALLPLE